MRICRKMRDEKKKNKLYVHYPPSPPLPHTLHCQCCRPAAALLTRSDSVYSHTAFRHLQCIAMR